MAPRIILYTGKGGVGKTSVAAATARRIAAGGTRTIVLSTDPAHSLADALGLPLGPAPLPVAEHLWAQQVDAQGQIEANWAGVQDWLGDVLVQRGVDRISAEELTVPPGMDELFSLLELKRHAESGEFACVVVDCAPTSETLRLLSLPDAARWWLARVQPQQSAIMGAARPFARMALDLQLPQDAVLDEVTGLVRNLIAMNTLLRDAERVSVRLVMTPDRMVVDEARRTFTYLNLYGFLTDAVVVNRIFPADVGPYFDAWRARQQEELRAVRDAFAPVPVLPAPYFESEVRGPEMLDRLGAAVFGARAAQDVLHTSVSEHLELHADGASLRLELPFAAREDVVCRKVGLELVVRANGHKRTMLLPAVLGDYHPAGASFADGALTVRFDAPARA